MTLALATYRCATWALSPLAGPVLRARARAGKEDPARLGERFGRASAARPTGRLVWMHGASVGETRVLMTLQAALAAARPDLEFLFTSGTRTSASLLAANPPARARHQYAPVDAPAVARRFFAHWRPDLGVFAESDIWPNLIAEAGRRGAPLALVNARISPESLRAWGRLPGAARRVLGAFEAIVAADARTAEGLARLLDRPTPAPGNLKFAAPAPAVDAAEQARLVAAIAGRRVWLAASTHPGEDEIALAAHARLRERAPEALLILCPRHPERGEAIAALAGGAPRRSRGEPIAADQSVYVADTMGEMGLFYASVEVALIGGSLLGHLKGHNPIEPAQLGCAALTGPHVESFAEAFAALRETGGVVFVEDAASLAQTVARLWADAPARTAQVVAAKGALGAGAKALAVTLDALSPLLPPP